MVSHGCLSAGHRLTPHGGSRCPCAWCPLRHCHSRQALGSCLSLAQPLAGGDRRQELLLFRALPLLRRHLPGKHI